MKFTEVNYSRLAEVYTLALREGIAEMFTEAYRTNDGYVLFIEPLEHKMEACVYGKSAIRLHYDKDNKTWDSVDFDEIYPLGETALKMELLLNIYEHVRSEKKIFYSRDKTS